ncbi:FMN-dependent NADH-azoreductase [Serratia sp. MYb239]|uniref:NAD(P)H-dependent oxidoreductase n=1 Tax=Serratia sp. MYb239 TaxID=2033438 RepID=UPI000CF687FC|nr:NAD(P)H-dependent oxidoreductase [Serratia sp. MYb239]AVJ19999.1 FMN-dependent NADH-azoreductase [Serratia sp. MYb239]MBU3893139.1 NAD(P)H-dependent oxidoreductase [Serratia rubidaea]
MSKLLVLRSSIMGVGSQSNALIDDFLATRRAKGLDDEIIEHDLTALNLPVLDGELFSAMRGAQTLSERAQRVVALSDRLIAELKASDVLLIGAPMYNLNVPTQLKNWFDLVVRAGMTFKYTANYPVGLVEGVRAIVVSPRGGVHVDRLTDAVTPYLRAVLGLIGVNDVEFIYAEGLDARPHGRAQGIAEAQAAIAALA